MSNIHPYVKQNSVLYGLTDEYSLSKEEYYLLYSFFVTYSMCGTQSAKKRSFVDYGWDSNTIFETAGGKKTVTSLGKALTSILPISAKDPLFVFANDNSVAPFFLATQLNDGTLPEYDSERAVIAQTWENNKYLKLFYRVRDGLAHGKFVLKYSSSNEKMVLIQDDDGKKVTARILLKLDTLLSFARVLSNGML